MTRLLPPSGECASRSTPWSLAHFLNQCSVSGHRGRQLNGDAYGQQLRLWISEIQLNLVYSWAVLKGVGSQVLVSVRRNSEARKPSRSIAHLHTLRLPAESATYWSWGKVVDSLADTDISDLAFVNQLFELLPGRVGVLS